VVTDQQVVTISPTGEISGLQRRSGLDLRQFGKAQIERVSEVLWHEQRQQWFVKFLTGPLAGKLATRTILVCATGSGTIDSVKADVDAETDVLYFAEYDDGVKAEITVLDGFRKKGLF
jgi:hypothetical protein